MNHLIYLIIFINLHKSSLYNYSKHAGLWPLYKKSVFSAKINYFKEESTKLDLVGAYLATKNAVRKNEKISQQSLEVEEGRNHLFSSIRVPSDKGNKTVKIALNQANQKEIHYGVSPKYSPRVLTCQDGEKRRQVSKLLTKYIGSEEYPIIEGMLLGGTDQVDKEQKKKVKIAGLSHILSASGSNVSLFLILNSPFIWRKFGKVFTTLITISFIFIYLSIAGCSAPLVRASLGSSLSLLGLVHHAQVSSFWLLAVTCCLMLSMQSNYLTDIGFQLSVAATFGILLAAKQLPKRRVGRLDVSILYNAKLDWQSNQLTANFNILVQKVKGIANNMVASCKTVVLFTLAAQLATLPITLYYFQELSIIAVVSNVVIVWIVPIILYGAILTVVCSALQLHLFARLSGGLATYCAHLFLIVVDYFSSFDFALLKLGLFTTYCILFIYLICILIYLIKFFLYQGKVNTVFCYPVHRLES